jgi:hypothetical protein
MVTLASAYNASRIISYLVIRTERFADDQLLDMRVHDIDVAVNLRATLPWVPEPPKNEEPQPVAYGGSSVSVPSAVPEVDNTINVAGATTSVWWTGWWPVLHVRSANILASGARYVIELSIDLLGNLGLVDLQLSHPDIEALNNHGAQVAAQDAVSHMQEELSPELRVIMLAIAGMFFVIDLLAAPSFVLPPPVYEILIGLLVAVSLLTTVWMYALWLFVISGILSAGAAIAALVEMAIFTFGLFVYYNVLGCMKFFGDFWWMKGLKGYGTWIHWGLAFHILNAVVKIVFLVATIILIFMLVLIWVSQYLTNPEYCK